MTSTKHASRAGLTILAALLLAGLAAMAYSPILGNDFINFDDTVLVTENPMIVRGLTTEGVVWAFTQNPLEYWLPLTQLCRMATCQVFGLNPMGHHLVSLLLHVANVVLFFVLVRQLTGKIPVAVAAAALLAVHPLHVESVAWVAEVKDVLSMLF